MNKNKYESQEKVIQIEKNTLFERNEKTVKLLVWLWFFNFKLFFSSTHHFVIFYYNIIFFKY